MKLHKKQKDFIDNIVYEVKNSPSSKKPLFLSVNSSPGSGKTTIILESCRQISSFLSKNIKYLQNTNVPIKQVLILVFDKKMKAEIEKKITKDDEINEDLFEITTVHSLFFRELKNLQKEQNKNESFTVDYTKGFFSKKDIQWFLESMSSKTPSLSSKIDKKIDNRRAFDTLGYINNKNIELLWGMVNAYYSTPFSLNMMNKISQASSFFLKNGQEFDELELSDEVLAILKKINKKNNTDTDEKELFFKLLIQRINSLATTKEYDEHITTKILTIPMNIEDKYGNIIKEGFQEIQKEERTIEYYDNIVKVPHCFYYKSFFNKIKTDKSFGASIFQKYKAVFVDEAQDNDGILFQILIKIAMDGIVKNFAFVGDALQAIYAFKSPDHFDMLSYMKKHAANLEKIGIRYTEHNLDITFRFGKEIANFVNSLFDSNIQSLGNKNAFVYPDEVRNDSLHILVKNLSDLKNKSIAIVCRSNAEAMRLFIQMRTKGLDNVVIHSSAKDELKDFSKKGSGIIENEKTKQGLHAILSQYFEEKELYSFHEILSSQEAIAFLASNGYSHLVRFSKDEINNYIMPANKKRKDVVWIGTAHLFKGAEFDYTITAGDFFKQKDSFDFSSIVDMHNTVTTSKNDADFINSFFNQTLPVKKEEQSVYQNKSESSPSSLKAQLNDIENHEEKCIYYVALTRAKEGVFFMETPYWNEIKNHIDNSTDVKKEFSHLLMDNNGLISEKTTKEDIQEDIESSINTRSLFS